MAKEDNYKEGVDFKWVDAKGTGGKNKTRHFFTKAEKTAMNTPKKSAPAKAKPVVKAPVKAAVKKEAPVAKDVMKGYRKGDVTTTKIPKNTTNEMRGKARANAKLTTGAARAITKAEKTAADMKKIPVPGRAVVQAFKNTFSGKGETDAAKIARGYAKGGMVTKKKC